MGKSILSIVITACIICSCSTYRPKGKLRTRVQKEYAKTDTLYLSDFILCYSRNEPDDSGFIFSPRSRMSPIDEDSILSIFQTSLTKLDLPISFETSSQNQCDTSFHRNYPVRMWKIDDERIKEIALHSENKTVLVPLIRLNQRKHIIVKGSPATTADIHLVSFLTLITMVVQNNEIIYRKGYLYSVGETVENADDPHPAIEQIHWDNMVRLAMEDYMERMK